MKVTVKYPLIDLTLRIQPYMPIRTPTNRGRVDYRQKRMSDFSEHDEVNETRQFAERPKELTITPVEKS